MYLVSILPENYLEALSTSKDNFGMGPKGKENETKQRQGEDKTQASSGCSECCEGKGEVKFSSQFERFCFSLGL